MASYEYAVETLVSSRPSGRPWMWEEQVQLDAGGQALPWDANSAKMACHLELARRYADQPETQIRIQRRRAPRTARANPGPWELHRKYEVGLDGILRRTDR